MKKLYTKFDNCKQHSLKEKDFDAKVDVMLLLHCMKLVECEI